MAGSSSLLPLTIQLLVGAPAALRGVDVSGRVKMPEICSPEVSPAVARLDPAGAATTTDASPSTDSRFIDQRGLRSEPWVIAMQAGEVLRFGNADPELHNVHLQGAGVVFNQSVAPARSVDFVPSHLGSSGSSVTSTLTCGLSSSLARRPG
jgi:hypothetical protein